jgi:hypothetical protein
VVLVLRRLLLPNRYLLGFLACIRLVRRVGVNPIGCYYFAVDYYAVGDVGANDCYGAFVHTWYSIQT